VSSDASLVAVRFAAFGAAIALFGAAAFRLYAPAPARAPRQPVLAAVAAPLGLALATFAYAALLAREITAAAGWPTPSALVQLWTSTGFGRALAVSILAAVLLAALRLAGGERPRARLALSWTALVALAFVGHAADGEGLTGDARLALAAAHLTAAGLWLGALPSLLLAVRAPTPQTSVLLRRFGAVGAMAVALILATGAAAVAFAFADARGRLGRAYATVLFVKLAFVAGLLALAAVNRFVLTPRAGSEPAMALRALRRTIVLEQALALGALAAVSALGQLDPAM